MNEPVDIETALRLLMIAALEGDAGCYRRLCAELAKLLRNYFRRRLHPSLASQAEDLVQETLMAIHVRRLTYDPVRPLMPWIYAIARYKLIDLVRQSSHKRSVPIDDVADFLADERDFGNPAAADLGKILETLPPTTAELLKGVKIHGQSIAEAARQAGLSETAAKVRLHRSLKTLTERFGGGK